MARLTLVKGLRCFALALCKAWAIGCRVCQSVKLEIGMRGWIGVGRAIGVATLVALLCTGTNLKAEDTIPAAPAQGAPDTSPPATSAPATPSDSATPPSPTQPATPPTPGAGTEPAPDGDASNAVAIEVAARPVALTRGNSTWEDGFKNINAAFKKLDAEVSRAGLKTAGRPVTVFVETDDNGFHYEAMLPLEKLPEGRDSLTPEVRLGQSPSGKAMKFQHRGAYDDIDSTYEAITAYLDEKGLEARNLFVEEYLSDLKASDDPSTKIDIYVFIK